MSEILMVQLKLAAAASARSNSGIIKPAGDKGASEPLISLGSSKRRQSDLTPKTNDLEEGHANSGLLGR